jgi:polar amino acid transport system permease protein
MGYDWHFSVLASPEYQRLLAAGFFSTLLLTLWCIVLGTPLGILLGSLPFFDQMGLRLTKHNGTVYQRLIRLLVVLASRFSFLLIDVVRAIPLLLLMLTSYYVLPVLVHHTVTPFTSVVVAMAFNLAAFVADLVRAAAAAISRGDILAARSLGMGQFLTWRRIVLPQVIREILPGLATLYITMLKMSTLASAVAVYELLHSADAVIQKTYRPLELYVFVCLVFVAVVMPLAYAARRLETSKFFLRRS